MRQPPFPAATLAFGFVLLLSGCAMKAYEGAARSDDQIAVIERWSRHGAFPGFEPGSSAIQPSAVQRYRHHAVVTQVDGQPVGAVRRIEVLPGRRRVRVDYARRPAALSCRTGACAPDYRRRNLAVAFRAMAGRTCRIRAERAGGRDWIWVEAVGQGGQAAAVVAGSRPPAERGKRP